MEPINTDRKPRVDPERWLDEYGDWLYQFALTRVQDTHAAEDLVQETLVAGVRGFGEFQQRSTVKTWLTSILRRQIADYFKQSGRRVLASSSTTPDNESDHFAFSVAHSRLFRSGISNEEFRSSMEREEFVEIVQRCLARLPLHLRQAFAARVDDDSRSLEEISSELDVSKNNLSVRLFRSRLLIRECLERFWTRH